MVSLKWNDHLVKMENLNVRAVYGLRPPESIPSIFCCPLQTACVPLKSICSQAAVFVRDADNWHHSKNRN